MEVYEIVVVVITRRNLVGSQDQSHPVVVAAAVVVVSVFDVYVHCHLLRLFVPLQLVFPGLPRKTEFFSQSF